MYRIVKKEQFGPATFLWEVEAPLVARAARPGHFLMVRIDETGERIPLTVADYDTARGTVTVVIQAIGKTTRQMMALPEGAPLLDFVGPLGVPSHIESRGTVVLVGGGLGVAPVFPLLRAYKEKGNTTIAIVGFRSRELMFWTDRFERYSDELHITTDDGSYGTKGLVTHALARVLEAHADVSEVFAIGPLVMMRACAEATRPRGIRTLVSLNSIMVDGTGMCGSCRVTIDGQMRFACVDGPDFDAHQVSFDELMLRQKRFEREEKEALQRYDRESKAVASIPCASSDPMGSIAVLRAQSETEAGLARLPELPPLPDPLPPPAPGVPPVVKTVRTIAPTKTPMPEQPPLVRARNFQEVNLGYALDQAIGESNRCLACKKPRCVPGCPVGIDIPGFISAVARRDLRQAYRILKASNAMPAVCGRVCPQESQCEATCIVGKKVESVAIGRLERFVADFAVSRGWDEVPDVPPTGKRAAIIGSGPSGLACAGDLIKRGVEVTVYEALHVAGGVLKYGIPEFRLPNHIIDIEIENLRRQGVRFELDAVVGKLFTVPQLLGEMGYHAVFIGTGAGSPKFMNIPGESYNGVFSANEFLTRVNLMRGNEKPIYDTPVGMGRRVAVVGAGNTAMDAARVALRIGADEVYIIYRRSERESPARAEELHHAKDEGIRFHWLTNPVRVLGNEGGWVRGLECVEMELGEPDASGRRRPIPKPGTEKVLEVDTLISALGTTANPILAQTTPGLKVNKWGYIEADSETGATSLPGVFAGGDIVTGAATVILAMGAGRKAASGILRHLGLDQSIPIAALVAR
ncbi:MAG TPA: NADPH-dependent glutamate synthase [Candidatus Polarisedimenticolia bacterium]|nr:NADPH-dependent glutamate synthase [Candidatus Polarisedimenticolia bacterium]